MSISDRLPAESSLNSYVSTRDYMDVFSVPLENRPDLETADMRVLADHILMADIEWMNNLISLRDRIVRPLGLKTTKDLAQEQSGRALEERTPGDRIGFFRIFQIDENEIILGEDDWHQDFRLSIFRRLGRRPRIYASTCCKRHNLFGHMYLAMILPFHKRIACSVLDHAVENGLPQSA